MVMWSSHVAPGDCLLSSTSVLPFQVERSVCDSTIEIRLSGELDLASAPALWSRLAPVIQTAGHSRPRLVLNVSGLEFMDAAGLGAVIRLANWVRSTGGSMSIRSPRPLVRRVLDLADVGRLLYVEPDLPNSR